MAEESVAREDVATLRTKYDTGRDFSPLKAHIHPKYIAPRAREIWISCDTKVSKNF